MVIVLQSNLNNSWQFSQRVLYHNFLAAYCNHLWDFFIFTKQHTSKNAISHQIASHTIAFVRCPAVSLLLSKGDISEPADKCSKQQVEKKESHVKV